MLVARFPKDEIRCDEMSLAGDCFFMFATYVVYDGEATANAPSIDASANHHDAAADDDNAVLLLLFLFRNLCCCLISPNK